MNNGMIEIGGEKWSEWRDSNSRPSGPKPRPCCSGFCQKGWFPFVPPVFRCFIGKCRRASVCSRSCPDLHQVEVPV